MDKRTDNVLARVSMTLIPNYIVHIHDNNNNDNNSNTYKNYNYNNCNNNAHYCPFKSYGFSSLDFSLLQMSDMGDNSNKKNMINYHRIIRKLAKPGSDLIGII